MRKLEKKLKELQEQGYKYITITQVLDLIWIIRNDSWLKVFRYKKKKKL